MKGLLITIDGPAGAGKTTVSRLLAGQLGYTYVDTGALYRSVALAVRNSGLDPEDGKSVEAVCRNLSLKYDRDRLLLNGEDVGEAIRTPEVSMMASKVSALPVVRDWLLELQRSLGREKCAVFEGRDMGTVVFPDADVKFFLDASVRIRAMRRYGELKNGCGQTLEAVEEEIRIRDKNDRTRAIAPLRAADDAVCIDATFMSADEVVRQMRCHIEAYL